MADVSIFQTPDGGDITIEDGVVTLEGGYNSAVYLSLFGGHEDWWGNIGEAPERQYISETQKLIDGLPLTSGNLLRVQDAVKLDLAWMVEQDITVEATIPALDTLSIALSIDGIPFDFVTEWGTT